MTRRTGWVAHYTLRLGLLLGGVAAVWGAHEVAAGSAAHAADRPPLTAAVETLTHTLGTVLGLPTSGSDGVEPAPAAAPASGTTAPASDTTVPARAADAPASGTAASGTASPGKAVATAPAAATPVTGRVVEAVVTPVRAHVLTPVTEGLRPATDPVREHLLTPVTEVLRPLTGPVTTDVLEPVADVLSPVVEPLSPILGPVWRGLEPVVAPLDPVLDPLSPVTDLLDPPAPPLPGPVDPTDPTDPAGPADPAEPAEPAAPAVPAGPAAPAPTAAPARVSVSVPVAFDPQARAFAVGPLGAAVRTGTPAVRTAADFAPTPVAPQPFDGASHAGGSVHSEAADADACRWGLPTLAHQYGRPAHERLPASRTSRPGTRPA
ncbi:hypothetical protein [Micromonospora sp. LA-10]|uniref:hypothetical protein n=1 Tax=Micromonospora sp. LA-10 TaxID=3446364 RepID=UPI003F7185A3